MKEEWINKLVELLNEREKELDPNIQVERTEFSVWINKWYLISKEYWFIKWLVDNDKIDFDKLEDNSDWYFIDLSDNYLEILALLSIQDNPIEFLISILKDKKVRTVYVDEDWNVSWDTKRYSDC